MQIPTLNRIVTEWRKFGKRRELRRKGIKIDNIKKLAVLADQISDPRKKPVLHKISTIVVVAILAVISGAQHVVAIEDYGKDNLDTLSAALNIPHGIPSHDTFSRLLTMINPHQLQLCINLWINYLLSNFSREQGNFAPEKEHIAIDGKMPLGRRNDNFPIYLLNSYNVTQHRLLAQHRIRDGANEISALPAMFDQLNLQNTITTIDAIGCQKTNTRIICNKGGDYLLALKRNQYSLYDDVTLYMADVMNGTMPEANAQYSISTEKKRGEIITRELWVTSNIGWLTQKDDWIGLISIAALVTTIESKNGSTASIRYFITSLESALTELIAITIRNHWGIENNLHRHLDVDFDEDISTVRKGYGPQNISFIRASALFLLRLRDPKRSINRKRQKAAGNVFYALAFLLGTI